jgi:hypothetical protein
MYVLLAKPLFSCSACRAGLQCSIARACEETAALLTQQQQQQQPEQQASPVLAKLLSPTTAYQLLDLWYWFSRMAPESVLSRGILLASPKALLTVEPACKLAVAAALNAASPAAAQSAAAAGAASSSSSSSSNARLYNSSSSSSSSRVHNTANSSTVTNTQIMHKVMDLAQHLSTSIHEEYWQVPKDEEEYER